jgi:hypothetical protein
MGQGEQQPIGEGGLHLALPPGQDLPAARVPPSPPLVVGQGVAPRPDLRHDGRGTWEPLMIPAASARPRMSGDTHLGPVGRP